MEHSEHEIDLNRLSSEQAELISAQLGEKTRLIFDKAIADANQVLNMYGLEAKFTALIGPVGKVAESLKKTKTEKPSKKKKTT